MMAPCTYPGMKRFFALKPKKRLGSFAPSDSPQYNGDENKYEYVYLCKK